VSAPRFSISARTDSNERFSPPPDRGQLDDVVTELALDQRPISSDLRHRKDGVGERLRGQPVARGELEVAALRCGAVVIRFLRATSANEAGFFFTSASKRSAFALALARTSALASLSALTRMWLARRSSTDV
jgi:hypothetical protein